MFTGIVEETGIIRALHPQGKGLRITVEAHRVLGDLKIDDSVSLNGVCQTVVARTASSFDVEAVEETLAKTTFCEWKSGQQINLERAMQLGGRLGGHLVQGHVDCTGRVMSIEEESTSHLCWVEFPDYYAKYVIPVGSICIDGISLTAARVEVNRCMVAIIPHTWKSTAIHSVRPGSTVNLEFDMLGKYIEKLLSTHRQPEKPAITEDWLQKMGY